MRCVLGGVTGVTGRVLTAGVAVGLAAGLVFGLTACSTETVQGNGQTQTDTSN